MLDPLSTDAVRVASIANYDLIVTGEAFDDPDTDLAAGFFRTAGSITAEDDTLHSEGRFHLRARESITITGNFLAEAGGEFLAQIEPQPSSGASGNARSSKEAEVPIPALPVLHSNYPNPFYHHTTFRFSIPEPGHVSLIVYDVLGRKIMTLLDQHHEAGNVTFHWTAADEAGRALASGIYLYRLQVGDYFETGRMTLLN